MKKKKNARSSSARTKAVRAQDQKRFEQGEALAQGALARRRKAVRARAAAAAAPRGLLIAEGDSWFDYPFFDVLEMLEDDGYEIESVAHKGDNLEDMAHDEQQLDRLAKALFKYRQRGLNPKAVLLSGGGNDIVGTEFPVLINHANSGLPAINDSVVDGIIEGRLRPAMASLIGTVTTLCRNFFGEEKRIVLHGYDYPIPDGRGYLGGFWVLPGPWMDPGFRRKGHFARSAGQAAQQLAHNAQVVAELIDRYNKMLKSLAAGFPHVRYVDLRGTLTATLAASAYRSDWGDELHPTKSGFRKVADAFKKKL